jgi:hypothetical protein
VLHPAATDQFSSGEDTALVLRMELDGIRVLLLSGLGRAGQRTLLSRTNDLHAEVVVAGIPLAGEPLSDLLLDGIQPRTIIIADRARPSHGAGARLRERLAARNVPVLYECDCRAVTVLLQPGKWSARGMEDQ